MGEGTRMTKRYYPHRIIRGIDNSIPHVSLAHVLSALRDGPKSVASLAPVDPVTIWGSALRKNRSRNVAAAALEFARSKRLVEALGPRLNGDALYALTNKGRKFAETLEVSQ